MEQVQLFDIDIYSDKYNIYLVGLENTGGNSLNINIYVGDFRNTNATLKVKKTVLISENKGEVDFTKSYLKAVDRDNKAYLFLCLYITDSSTTSIYKIVNTVEGWKFQSISTPIKGFVTCMDTDKENLTGDIYLAGSFGIGALEANNDYTYKLLSNQKGILSISCSGNHLIAGKIDDYGRLYISSDYGTNWSLSGISTNDPMLGGIGKIIITHKYHAQDENQEDAIYLGFLLFQAEGISRAAINLSKPDIEVRWYPPLKNLKDYGYEPSLYSDAICLMFEEEHQIAADILLINVNNGIATDYMFNLVNLNPGDFEGTNSLGINKDFKYDSLATVRPVVRAGNDKTIASAIYALTPKGELTIALDDSVTGTYWEKVAIIQID